MKNLFFTLAAVCTFGYASAQTDLKTQSQGNQPDSTVTNAQLKKESDLKTMDAVKTQDHVKVTPKTKQAAKDTLKTKKRMRPSNSTNRP